MAARDVEFAHVNFSVPGGRLILRNISLHVGAGETVALLGRSGSGKTTLLRTVNALVRPTSGQVLVGGRDVAREDIIQLRRSIGYVIQEAGLFPHKTAEQNVCLPLEIAGSPHSPEDTKSHVDSALEKVGFQDHELIQRYPWQLSGGQRQRIGVARALVMEPGVLLMDEPFGALDPLTRTEMQAMLRSLLKRVKTTTLIVTHDLEEALYLADRIVLLEAGEIVADLPSQDILTSDHAAVQAYVKAARRTESA